MKAILRRFANAPDGVFGYLDLYDAHGSRVARWPTCEDDWLDNLLAKSCIPVGTYQCDRYPSPTFGETFQIMDVPGRSYILFHYGNTEEDVKGCVLIGSDFGAISVRDEDDPGNGPRLKWAVTRSRVAFRQFMGLLRGVQSFPLEVVWDIEGAWRTAP